MSRSHPRRRALSIAAVLAATALGLAGCLDTGFPGGPTSSTTPSSTASHPASAAPTHSASPSATPSATPSAGPATPVSLSCDALIPLQPLYDLNPNYALVPTSSAAGGSLAAAALADKGTACQVVHTSSSATAVVTISQPSASALAADERKASQQSNTTEESVNAQSGAKIATIYRSGSSIQGFTAKHRFTAEGGASFDPEDVDALIKIAIGAQG